MRRGAWSTRYAFYLATVGSAFSLGNLWRFPYVVNSNGGGAFVLLYILCALALGLPIVVAELMLGKLCRNPSEFFERCAFIFLFCDLRMGFVFLNEVCCENIF